MIQYLPIQILKGIKDLFYRKQHKSIKRKYNSIFFVFLKPIMIGNNFKNVSKMLKLLGSNTDRSMF